MSSNNRLPARLAYSLSFEVDFPRQEEPRFGRWRLWYNGRRGLMPVRACGGIRFPRVRRHAAPRP
jgi:hypothetical protein